MLGLLARFAGFAILSVSYSLLLKEPVYCTGGHTFLNTSKTVTCQNKNFYKKGVVLDCSGPLHSAVTGTLRTMEQKRIWTGHCMEGRMKDGWARSIPDLFKPFIGQPIPQNLLVVLLQKGFSDVLTCIRIWRILQMEIYALLF